MKRYAGFIYMLLSAFFFSLIGVISKTAFNTGIETMDLLILQNFVTLLILAVYFSINKFKDLQIPWEDIKTIGIQGVFGSTAVFIFFYLSIERLNASIASMLLFIHPTIITLYFIIFEGLKMNWRKVSAIFMTFLGSILVLNLLGNRTDTIDFLGVLFGIGSSISQAFYNIYAEKKLKKFKGEVILFFCSVVVLLLASLINPNFYAFDFPLNTKLVICIVLLSVGTGILPVLFLYKGIQLLGAQISSIIATAELPFTVLLSMLILGERFTVLQALGSALIIASIIILQYE